MPWEVFWFVTSMDGDGRNVQPLSFCNSPSLSSLPLFRFPPSLHPSFLPSFLLLSLSPFPASSPKYGHPDPVKMTVVREVFLSVVKVRSYCIYTWACVRKMQDREREGKGREGKGREGKGREGTQGERGKETDRERESARERVRDKNKEGEGARAGERVRERGRE